MMQQGRLRRVVVILAALAAYAPGLTGSAAGEIALSDDPRIDANDFRVTAFATGLGAPFGMLEQSDGSLLVGETLGNFADPTQGRLVRLIDTNGDGVADGSPSR